MTDHQQQQPLVKSTPRHNNKSQTLQNLSLNIERLISQKEKKIETVQKNDQQYVQGHQMSNPNVQIPKPDSHDKRQQKECKTQNINPAMNQQPQNKQQIKQNNTHRQNQEHERTHLNQNHTPHPKTATLPSLQQNQSSPSQTDEPLVLTHESSHLKPEVQQVQASTSKQLLIEKNIHFQQKNLQAQQVKNKKESDSEQYDHQEVFAEEQNQNVGNQHSEKMISLQQQSQHHTAVIKSDEIPKSSLDVQTIQQQQNVTVINDDKNKTTDHYDISDNQSLNPNSKQAHVQTTSKPQLKEQKQSPSPNVTKKENKSIQVGDHQTLEIKNEKLRQNNMQNEAQTHFIKDKQEKSPIVNHHVYTQTDDEPQKPLTLLMKNEQQLAQNAQSRIEPADYTSYHIGKQSSSIPSDHNKHFLSNTIHNQKQSRNNSSLSINNQPQINQPHYMREQESQIREPSENHQKQYSQQNHQQQQYHEYKIEEQQQQPPQPLQPFSLTTYKSIEPLLQQLLVQLKNTLKIAKQQHSKPPVQKAFQQNNNHSKFFNNQRPSRSESRNKPYYLPNTNTPIHNNQNSNSLIDIIQRRNQAQKQRDHHYHGQQSKPQNTSYYQQNHNKQRINLISGKTKIVPFGLGNVFGDTNVDRFPKMNQQQPNRDSLKRSQAQNNGSRISSHLQHQYSQQRILQNRTKANSILPPSGPNNYNQRPKANSFFSQGESQLPQGVTRYGKQQNLNESLYTNQEHQISRHSQSFHSRKVIKSSNNFTKPPLMSLYNNNINPQMTSDSQLPSQKATIQRLHNETTAHHSTSFFTKKPLSQTPSVTSLTPILKIVKHYLKIIAEGRIDDIESFLNQYVDNLQLMSTSLNEMIGRKKLFKLALYYERVAIVAGVCYGYLMITQQRGCLRYQVEKLTSQNKQPQTSTTKPTQHLKQHSKMIIKYMINLVSFCLNNAKLITKTIETYLLKTPQIFDLNQSNHNTKRHTQQQQLIEKQCYKRNIETIKLNVQYIQQTLQKLFAETYQLGKAYGIDEDFGESFKNVTKIVNKNTIQQSFYTLLEYFSYYLCLAKRQKSIPFLAVAPNPYIDPCDRYTLVIDFVSVFCHGTKRSKTFIFRPYSQHFLYEMSQYFDIVLISDALPQQIDKIIDIVDPKGIIQNRLYKYHMVEDRHTGKYTKNLQRLGREMSKTILLDVDENRVNQQSKNTIFINEWRGSRRDSALAELCSVLVSIVMQGLDCDRAAKRFDKQMKSNQQKGIRFINFGLNLKQQNDHQSTHLNADDELLRQTQNG